MLWFLLWLVLLTSAVAIFAYLGLHLYRQTKALTADVSAASARLSAILAAMADQIPSPRTDSQSRQ